MGGQCDHWLGCDILNILCPQMNMNDGQLANSLQDANCSVETALKICDLERYLSKSNHYENGIFKSSSVRIYDVDPENCNIFWYCLS